MRKIWDYWLVMRLHKNALEVKLDILRYCNFLRSNMKGFLQWSMPSLLLIGLLFVVLVFLVLTVTFFMKPELKRPQIVWERVRLPITPIEKEEEPTIPRTIAKKGREETPLGGDTLEEGKPIMSKFSELPIMIRERGLDKKVVIIGGIEKDEKAQTEGRRYKDRVFRQEIAARDIKIEKKTPETIFIREEPSAREIKEKSVKDISKSSPITSDRVKLKRQRGPIEATPAKTFEPEKKSVDFTVNEEMAKAKRAKKGEEKIPKKDTIGDSRDIYSLETSSLFVKPETAITAQKSVTQPNELIHSPMDPELSIKVEEERISQLKPPPLIATEVEVKLFLAYYRERYSLKDIEDFLSLFSSKALQNGRDGFDRIRMIYSDFFDQSQELRYRMENTRIQIYQNSVRINARYKVDQILKKGGKKKSWKGDIRWILIKENGALKIRYLNFKPQKSH